MSHLPQTLIENDAPSAPPMQLGRYVLLAATDEELGEAYDPRLDRRVLVKRLDEESAWQDALALAQLQHPHILRVHDLSAPPPLGLGYVTFALPDGGKLDGHLPVTRAWRRTALRAMVEVGEALLHAHGKGFVHHGLKSASVWLHSDGTAQVHGFIRAPLEHDASLAAQRDLSAYVTLLTQVLGTPRWLRRALKSSIAPVDEKLRGILSQLRAQPGRGRYYALAGLAFVVAAASAWLLFNPRPGWRCPQLGSEASALWTTSRADAIRSALLRTGKPYARDAARRVDEMIQTYLRHFSAAGQTLCQEAAQRGKLPEPVRELRVACLTEHLRKLDATLNVLQEADDEITQRAVSLIDNNLRDAELQTCLRILPEPLAVAPPHDQSAEVTRIRDVLARGTALYHSGKYKRARTLLEQATREADKTGYAPIQAEAALLFGDILRLVGEYEESETWLHRAAALAEASRQDRVAAQSWQLLIFVLGDRLGRLEQAEEYAEYAKASLRRCARCDDLRPALADRLGQLRFQQGRPTEALALYEDALAQRQRIKAPVRDIMASYNQLANVLDSLERRQESLEYHRRAIALAEAEYGSSHPQLSVLLSNLAETEQSLGDLPAARKSAERALQISLSALGEQHPHTGRIENVLAGTLLELGDYPAALVRIDAALTHLQKSLGQRHAMYAHALMTKGSILSRMSSHDKAREVFQEALRIRETLYPPTHLELAFVAISLARAQLALHDLSAASTLLDRARHIIEHSGEKQAAQKELWAGLLFASAIYEREQFAHSAEKQKTARADAEKARQLYAELGDGFRYEAAETERFLRAP